MFVTDYKQDIIGLIGLMRKEFMEINTDTNHRVQYVKSKMNAIEPRFEELYSECRNTVEKSMKNEAKVEEFYTSLLHLEQSKTDIKFFKD